MVKEKEKKDPLAEVLENLNKKYGKGTVLTLGEKLTGNYDVISTGSLAFDYKVLGIGGF
ncbi:MAG: DNA recombination/repair protein RecA, partial [Tissierellales bacterium]|nr:DNA recombination/repair protein RecA [Tissierellales bacterium]